MLRQRGGVFTQALCEADAARCLVPKVLPRFNSFGPAQGLPAVEFVRARVLIGLSSRRPTLSAQRMR